MMLKASLFFGAARSICKVSHYWRWEQKYEEYNNAASPKNNGGADYRRGSTVLFAMDLADLVKNVCVHACDHLLRLNEPSPLPDLDSLVKYLSSSGFLFLINCWV